MKLTKLALITALIGTALLLFLSEKVEPKEMQISEIDYSMLDSFVKVSGQITKIEQHDKLTTFDLKDKTETITVITYEKINLTSGSETQVIGKVTEWEGTLEIEASRIKEIEWLE